MILLTIFLAVVLYWLIGIVLEITFFNFNGDGQDSILTELLWPFLLCIGIVGVVFVGVAFIVTKIKLIFSKGEMMMSNGEKIVEYEKYCEKCEYSKLQENEEPCDSCLLEPVNVFSHKPVKFKEKR